MLLAATHTPGASLPDAGLRFHDKLIHFAAYAVLAVLAAAGSASRGGRLPAASAAVVMSAIAVTAAADEFTQPWVGRTCDPFDWLADVAGAAVGVGAYALLQYWWRR